MPWRRSFCGLAGPFSLEPTALALYRLPRPPNNRRARRIQPDHRIARPGFAPSNLRCLTLKKRGRGNRRRSCGLAGGAEGIRTDGHRWCSEISGYSNLHQSQSMPAARSRLAPSRSRSTPSPRLFSSGTTRRRRRGCLMKRRTESTRPARSRRGGGWNWVGVVSGLFNPNDSGIGALERRPRHDEGYHEGGGCGRRSFAFG